MNCLMSRIKNTEVQNDSIREKKEVRWAKDTERY